MRQACLPKTTYGSEYQWLLSHLIGGISPARVATGDERVHLPTPGCRRHPIAPRAATLCLGSLCVAWSGQGEPVHGGEGAVRSGHRVVRDVNSGCRAGAARVDVECGKSVGMHWISHRRPGRILHHVGRRAFSGGRVHRPDRGQHPGPRGENSSWLEGEDVPPPPITMCTVPLPVSSTPVLVWVGIGVRVSVGCCPRIGCERS